MTTNPVASSSSYAGDARFEAQKSSAAAPRLEADLLAMGRAARAAARALALMPTAQKNNALMAAAAALRADCAVILEANAQDYALAEQSGQNSAFLDRLKLTPARVEAIAVSLEEIAALPDPVGAVMAQWTQPNGLKFERVRTPLGVIGVIFESRPNVTADAGALCFKAGNACLLRTGSGALLSAKALHAALVKGLRVAGAPVEAIQLVPVADREAVGLMLSGLKGAMDVLVPRGGKSLVARVQNEARVPVFAHLEGNNHVYIHADADPAMALAITLNAKMRRTGVCGAAETLLIDKAVLASHLPPILAALREKGCALRGDAAICALDAGVVMASEADWATEYLEAILAIRCVDGLEDALAHIARYGSHHTEAIVTANEGVAERFLREVDAAIVLHNASTQFADGGEFGFGAEIGIATGRMHARGPVGLEQLTSFHYRVRGQGTVRA